MDKKLSKVEKNNKPSNISSGVDVEQKLSVISVVCRICYDNDKDEPLIAPCKCKGTVAFVHRSCLETWLAESNTNKCELCHHAIQTERTPKYNSVQSIWYWCWYSPRVMGHAVRGDIIACTMITPLAIIITYVCLFSSEYYNQRKFATVPAARWTSVSLLVMIAVMLMGYYLWVYSVIRMNARLWYNWWQRACVVRYIAPNSVTISVANIIVSEVPSNTPNQNFVGANEEGGLSHSESEDEASRNPVVNSRQNDVVVEIGEEVERVVEDTPSRTEVCIEIVEDDKAEEK